MAVFGAIHVAAWNAHFPSSTERILWLVSSITVAFISLTYGLGVQVVWWVGSAGWKEVVPSTNGAPVRYTHALGSLVILAHIYLFIGTWIDLRSLPVSAFQTVDWATVFPHVS